MLVTLAQWLEELRWWRNGHDTVVADTGKTTGAMNLGGVLGGGGLGTEGGGAGDAQHEVGWGFK